MGAGHCQWGGLTDQNLCNIYGDAHLASRYRVILRPRNFSTFDTGLASHPGNLPILEHLSRRGFLPFSNFWQIAKISWHAANSTPSDPPWSWIVPHIALMTRIGLENACFHGHLALTFDPWPRKQKNRQAAIRAYLSAKSGASWSNGVDATDVWKSDFAEID